MTQFLISQSEAVKIALDEAAKYEDDMAAAVKTHSDAGAGHSIGARSAALAIADKLGKLYVTVSPASATTQEKE